MGMGGGVAAFAALVWLAVSMAGDYDDYDEGWDDGAVATQYVELIEDFRPDPFRLELLAGGPATPDQPGCAYGSVPIASSVVLAYAGSGRFDLYFYAVASGDTTLHVGLPDGRWLCDDDSFGDGDPLVVIPNAPGGAYEIWVGSMEPGQIPASFFISELDPRTRGGD